MPAGVNSNVTVPSASNVLLAGPPRLTVGVVESTLIVLFDVQINQPVPAGRFQFVPPEDADLVGVPLVADRLN